MKYSFIFIAIFLVSSCFSTDGLFKTKETSKNYFTTVFCLPHDTWVVDGTDYFHRLMLDSFNDKSLESISNLVKKWESKRTSICKSKEKYKIYDEFNKDLYIWYTSLKPKDNIGEI